MLVAVTNVGVCTPFGRGLGALLEGKKGTSVLQNHTPLDPLNSNLAGISEKTNFRKSLKRRKDAKLLTPAARLALDAAAQSLGDLPLSERPDLALYVGVGREPPDEGEAEASLAAAHSEGVLDVELLAGVGRDLYPPLLPLKTLPNMILAHISIHLDIGGENGAWAGGPEAGEHSMRSAYWSIVEGRSKRALAGGADSLVDLGQARDLLRMGITSPPGEGSVFFLLESMEIAKKPLFTIEWNGEHVPCSDLRRKIGYCGAAEGLIHLASRMDLPGEFSWGGFQVCVGDVIN